LLVPLFAKVREAFKKKKLKKIIQKVSFKNKKKYGKYHNWSDPTPSPPFLAKIMENFEKY